MISNTTDKGKKILSVGLGFSFIIAVLFIVPLFINRDFYSDWFRNVWIIQYYGEYFKTHHSFPDVINSIGTWKYVSQVGMMHPIYYGQWLYRILGFLCAVIPYGSARKAIMISSFILAAGETYSWFRLSYSKSSSRIISMVISCAIVLAPYTVSNMYLANTIPQHYAFSCIMTAIPVWIMSFEKNGIRRMAGWFLTALLAAVAAGSHPITALLGGTFLFTVIVITLIKNFKEIRTIEWVMGIIIAMLVIGCIVNWLYAVISVPSNAAGYGELVYAVGRDSLYNRLRLIPFNYETAVNGVRNVISPYASSQVSIPILLMMLTTVGWSIVIRKPNETSLFSKTNIPGILLMILYILLLGCSCNYYIGRWLPDVVGVIQFPTRLIYYVDAVGALSVTVSLEYIQKYGKEDKFSGLLKYISVFAFGIVICGFTLNCEYINSIEGVVNYDASAPLSLTNGFYNADDYASLGFFGDEIEADDGNTDWADGRKYFYPINSISVSNDEFGDAIPTDISLLESGFVGINMYQHPWNSLYIDGVKTDNLMLHPDKHHEYVFATLNEGEHKLEYRFEPPSGYYITQFVSYIGMLILALGALICTIMCFKDRKMSYKD